MTTLELLDGGHSDVRGRLEWPVPGPPMSGSWGVRAGRKGGHDDGLVGGGQAGARWRGKCVPPVLGLPGSGWPWAELQAPP